MSDSVPASDRKLRNFRIAALLLLPALFVTAELGLRIRELMKPRPSVTSVWREDDPWLGYRLIKGKTTPDWMAYINREGLRGDEAHVETAPGAPRILILGNSCVFGAGSWDTEIFPVILETRLHKSGLESAIVFNAGVGGYNSNQCRAYLERELWRFKPDHLIIYMGWNDLVTSTWPGFSPGFALGPTANPVSHDGKSSVIRMLDHSKVFWHARAWMEAWSIRNLHADGGRDTWNESWISNYRANLDAIATDAERRGTRVFFCLLPYDHSRYPEYYARNAYHYSSEGYRRLWSRFQDEIRGAGGKPGRTVVDLPAAIAGIEHDTSVILDYNHLGPLGHERVASALFDALRPMNRADTSGRLR